MAAAEAGITGGSKREGWSSGGGAERLRVFRFLLRGNNKELRVYSSAFKSAPRGRGLNVAALL